MNLLLLTEDDQTAPGRFVLSDRRHDHLVTVLNAEVGRPLRVGLWDGPKGVGRVVSVAPDRTEVEVEWTEPTPERPRVHLILAIPRPKSLKKLLPEIVALGVGRLTLVRSWRVAQPYLSSPMLTAARQRPLIIDGLMQSGCTRPPFIDVHTEFKPFAEDIAPALTADDKWVLHPRATRPMSDLRPGDATVVVAVGPEGGWIDYEVRALEQAGFRSVHMGARILRVETACVALLAQLSVLRSLAGPEATAER